MHRLFWSPIVTHTVKGKILSTGFNCWTWIKDFSSVSALRKKETLPHMIENSGVARVKLLWWAYKSNTDCNLKARLHCVICICSISRTGKWQCLVVFYFMWMVFLSFLWNFYPGGYAMEVLPLPYWNPKCISPFRNDVCIYVYSLRQLSLSK